ncbi:MAG: hypothetical protein NT051_04590 [Candidatus Micrarchaeota archaeon]|nr:hypothetical protein [Candidatus Micrarchaeota archaeon]
MLASGTKQENSRSRKLTPDTLLQQFPTKKDRPLYLNKEGQNILGAAVIISEKKSNDPKDKPTAVIVQFSKFKDILPANAIQSLKSAPLPLEIIRHYDEASVVFPEIKGTDLSKADLPQAIAKVIAGWQPRNDDSVLVLNTELNKDKKDIISKIYSDKWGISINNDRLKRIEGFSSGTVMFEKGCQNGPEDLPALEKKMREGWSSNPDEVLILEQNRYDKIAAYWQSNPAKRIYIPSGFSDALGRAVSGLKEKDMLVPGLESQILAMRPYQEIRFVSSGSEYLVRSAEFEVSVKKIKNSDIIKELSDQLAGLLPKQIQPNEEYELKLKLNQIDIFYYLTTDKDGSVRLHQPAPSPYAVLTHDPTGIQIVSKHYPVDKAYVGLITCTAGRFGNEYSTVPLQFMQEILGQPGNFQTAGK